LKKDDSWFIHVYINSLVVKMFDSGCCEALWIVFFALSICCNEIFRNQNPSNSYMYMKDIIWLSITDFLNNKKI